MYVKQLKYQNKKSHHNQKICTFHSRLIKSPPASQPRNLNVKNHHKQLQTGRTCDISTFLFSNSYSYVLRPTTSTCWFPKFNKSVFLKTQ